MRKFTAKVIINGKRLKASSHGSGKWQGYFLSYLLITVLEILASAIRKMNEWHRVWKLGNKIANI